MIKKLTIAFMATFLLGFLVALIGAAAPPDPREAARLNNIGVAYMNQQLFEKGLNAFEEAAAKDPNLKVTALNRGVALLNLQRVDEAKALLQKAAQDDPKDAHPWYSLGLYYKNSDSPQDAVAAFHRVTEIDPNDADAWYFLGSTYAQLKQYPQAIDAFEQALKIDPLHASAQFGLSRAFQQSGQADKAREGLKKFQYITQNKLGSPISLAYGEQGKYSRAEESPVAVEKVPAAIPVKFVDVTKESGIVSRPGAETASGARYLGPGACFLDYDNDGNIDLLLADNGTQGSMSLYHNLGNGKFEDVTQKAGLDGYGPAISCTAGDYDNDGFADLAVSLGNRILLFHNEKNGTFKDVAEQAGLNTEKSSPPANPRNGKQEVTGLTFVDYDHDGDLDLYVTRLTPEPPETWLEKAFPGSNMMWRNNGNGTFTDVTEATGLKSLNSTDAAIGTDFNNDRAVDIVTTQAGNLGRATLYSPILFENPREGKFRRLFLAESDPSVGVAALDFDHDGWMDYAFTHFGMPGISLWRNNHGRTFEEVQLPKYEWHRGWGVVAFDYDNDGWVDLAFVGQKAIQKPPEDEEVRARKTFEVRFFRNLGPDGWKDVSAETGLDNIQLKEPRAIIVGDYDNDGAVDLLITQIHGPAVLLRNEGGNKNISLRLALKGLNDNKSAIGTKVEVFSAGLRQKFEVYGSSGYLGQNSPYLTIGLGQAKEADVVRMTWPTGVLQDEIEVSANKPQNFLEIDRRGSSCPTLFVWDGQHYELVGDMLGAGVVGHWVGPNERNIARPTEYIKLDRNTFREKDDSHSSQNQGRVEHPMLSFRFMEPLEESVYLDRVQLLAVDHPADVDVYPNEYFASNPPYPPFKVVFSSDARPPAGAWDEHGHSVLPDLLAHRYFGDFKVLSFAGFTAPHTLELDLGEPYHGGPLWLLMHGEIEYFTATSMYAADQAHIQPFAPYVEALVPNENDAQGKWVRVIDDLGFPAGGPRTMTADLTGRLPAGTQRIRLTTNLQIYWDNILISPTRQDQSARLTPVPLSRADLSFHGFPLKIENQPPGNVKYIYEKVSATGPYTRPAGAYTRYGDVRPLLNATDDKFAVFGSGDEVALDFDPANLPVLPQGWVRDYFFAAHGYEKDMDFYAYRGDMVEPLPFRDMGTYPYPSKSFPADPEHLDYLLEYNTRFMSGNEATGYSFRYPEQR
ncbi:MAG: VCBS repeat-containing protein [Candidatus Koribacter versatilis]|nr:VCBS repeat-containing protein [Candidatus Koribacter versatilis]